MSVEHQMGSKIWHIQSKNYIDYKGELDNNTMLCLCFNLISVDKEIIFFIFHIFCFFLLLTQCYTIYISIV